MSVQPAGPPESRPRAEFIAAVVATAVLFATMGLLILARYRLRHYSYPVGWDSAYYVWRSAAVTVDGLARIGTVRAGSPLLVGILMRVTGQNGFTMVAVAMAVLAAIVALGTAAMSRGALGVNAGWMVLVGALSWVAFGHIGMIPGGHLDNVLNAAFVVSAFAAAVSFAGQRKGAVATAVLFAASALAEWPFYVLAGAIFLLGLALFAWPAVRTSGEHRSEVLRVVRPMLVALGASAVFASLAILARPQGRLLHHFSAQDRVVIKERFMQRLRDPARWYALPLAVLGGLLMRRVPLPSRRDPARKLFLSLMVAWIVVTLGASAAQLFDVPVAGGRLLNYLFAVPLLAGVFLWALNRELSVRYRKSGMLLGALIALAAAVGFGTLAWQGDGGAQPSIPPSSVRQAAAAGQYAGTTSPNAEVIILQGTGRHAWEVLQASLPPDLVPRVKRFSGTPAELEERVANGVEGEAVVFVLRAYSPSWYRDGLAMGWSTVAPGVLVRSGSSPSLSAGGAPPEGSFAALDLIWIVGAVALLLAAAGSGWAVALLPSDPLIRVALAPALGAATITLAAVMWDRLGLGFSTVEVWVLALLTTGAGWALAEQARRRGPPAASTQDRGGEATAPMNDP